MQLVTATGVEAVNANDIHLAAQGANMLGPTFWLWGIGIIFQTIVFSVIGTWAVSRFIDRMIEKIRKEIDDVVDKLAAADKKVEKETGDTIAAMRQHVSNLEKAFEKRFHAAEKKALEDRSHYLEFFVRRESFKDVTNEMKQDVDGIAKEMRDGFAKVFTKMDEIRDRKAA